MTTNDSHPDRWRWRCLVGLCAVLAAATALRIAGARNDLWLDEIWSLGLTSEISSPLEAFTNIHHDNNHYLNTLCLYFFGARGNWPGYRIPSVVAGVGSVILAWLIGRRRSTTNAFLASLLVAFSYVMVLYSSEARGYASVVFFSFLSYYLLDDYLKKRHGWTAFLFSISAVLGFASHLSFLGFFCAAFIWSGYRLIESQLGWRRVITALLACYAVPTACLVTLYLVDIRYMMFGGGAVTGLFHGYAASLAWALGTPLGNPAMIVTGLVAVVLFGMGIQILWREKSDLWILFVGTILVMPILLAIVEQAEKLYVRYFIVGMAFLLILFSYVLASLCQRGWRGKTLCVLLLAGYLAANGWHIATLFQYGRGRTSAAIQFIAGHTKGPIVTIGADHDFRVLKVLQFYAPETIGNKPVEYFPIGSWPSEGPEWVVCHKESFETPVPRAPQLADAAGNQYDFVKTFQTAPLSGLHWFLYHNRAKG